MDLEKQIRRDIITLSSEKPNTTLKPKKNQSKIGMKYNKSKNTTPIIPPTNTTNSVENSTAPKPEVKTSPVSTSNPFEKFKTEWKATLEGSENTNSGTEPAGSGNEPTVANPQPITPPAPAVEITGETVLLLVNTVFPLLAVIGVRVFTRNKKKVSLAGMKLTAEEKESLEELANACAAELLGMLKPIHLFCITLGSIYMGKIIAQIEDNENYVPKEKKAKKNENKS